MRWLGVVLGLVLTLSAQAPLCPNRTIHGHWGLQASHCDRAFYLQAFSDGGGTLGTDAEAAIDRYYSTPQQYYGRAEELNLLLQKDPSHHLGQPG